MNDAQRKELDDLADSNEGILTAEAVVDYARNRETALHAAFVWDNKEAAHLYRLDQARQLIRFYIVHEQPDDRPIRAYISVPSDRTTSGGYRKTLEVLQNDSWVAELVNEVAAKVKQMKDSYAHLRQLDDLWPRLDDVVEDYLRRFQRSDKKKAK